MTKDIKNEIFERVVDFYKSEKKERKFIPGKPRLTMPAGFMMKKN